MYLKYFSMAIATMITVERKEGQYLHDGKTITVVDLPGVYSLDAEDGDSGLDELVARDYLLSGEADVIVNITEKH